MATHFSFLPEKFMDGGAWQVTVCGVGNKELDMAE